MKAISYQLSAIRPTVDGRGAWLYSRLALLPLVLALASATTAIAQQQAPPTPGTPQPFAIPDATEFSLSNGLDVTLVPWGDVPKVNALLVVRAGNVDESPSEVWLANLTADLLQEGTTSRTSAQVAAEAAGMGGSIAVGVGANTTTIGGAVLSEFGPSLLALIADVAQNPRFPASELDRLKASQLRNLSIAKSQPQQIALEKFRSVLYPQHPYGRVFPTPEMVQGYTIEQVRGFYGRNFNAGRARLYVAGRFDVGAVEAAIRQSFGDWQGGAESLPVAPSPSTAKSLYLVDKPGAVQSTIYMGLPVVDPSHTDYIALQVTNSLLGGSFASRIIANIREDKGYSYSPVSSLSSRYRDAYWIEAADVTTNVTGASIKEILYEVDRLRTEAPSVEELRGIQNYLAGTFVLQNSTREGIIAQLSFLDLHGLPEDWLETYVQKVYAFTPQDILRVMRAHLDPSRMTTVVVGDRSQVEEQLRPFGDVRVNE